MGWLMSIIVGGLSGWLAEKVMKSNTGIFVNIILGIVGSTIASVILKVVGVHFHGVLGHLIAGFLGACLLIFIGRAIKS